jgi:BirA family biotin operon repressor/biotin-[acetyl-CoA-carboxylase] ligase
VTAAIPGGAWTRHLADPAVRGSLAGARTLTSFHPVTEVGSTQDLARELASEGRASGTLVIADRQLAGRGRAGRRWDDDPTGGTLAMTLLLDIAAEPDGWFPPTRLPLIPHALGLAVVEACSHVTPRAARIRLKWPNDVVHRATPHEPARKLCGVLVEREQVVGPAGPRDVLLCGVGIDVDLRASPEAPDRTCLATLQGDAPDRAALLGALVTGIDRMLTLLAHDPGALLDRYRTISDTIGRHVSVEQVGGTIVGRAHAIDAEGRLLVTTDARTHAILSGTVRDAGADVAVDVTTGAVEEG